MCVDFQELLNKIAARFASKKAFAKEVGIDPSRMSRALNGTDKLPFNVENCLRLAQISGEPPSKVLRAADKAKVANLIESLYGPERKMTDPVLQDLLDHWPTFPADVKAFVRQSVSLWVRSFVPPGTKKVIIHKGSGKSSTANDAGADQTNMSTQAPDRDGEQLPTARKRDDESSHEFALKKRRRSGS